jgi:hypothetical protein
MHSSILLILASALAACALPQANSSSGFVDASYSDADLAALDSIIDALNSHAATTVSATGAVTRTAQGYVSLGSASPTFSDIAVRATNSATQTVIVPDLNLQITQYINPITTSPPSKAKRHLFERDLVARGHVPVDVCPVPKTVTVIEWIDCKATPAVACNVCPTTKSCDCEQGYEWVVLAAPTTTPCSTTTPTPCSTTTKACPTCRGGIEYIILAETEPDNYKKRRPCQVCPGGFEYVIADGSDCGMDLFYIIGSDGKNNHPTVKDGSKGPGARYQPKLAIAGKARITAAAPTATPTPTGGFVYSGTLIVSSNSKLVVSTEFPLMADWASLLTWDLSSATVAPVPVMTGTSFSHIADFLVTDGPVAATPTLDAAAMRKRGMMKYMEE